MDLELRIRSLLEELLDSERTPEEVCRDCPELLPEVHQRWSRKLACDAQLDAMFPVRIPDSSSRVTSSADLPQVPGHELHEVLGHGGMGVVYKARHLRLNREVAVKMMLTGAHAGLEARERFLREAGAAAALRHPNIVQVYDMGDKDGQPYFTMEFVEGGNLARKLAGIPQPPRQAAELLATLAEAVEAAHRSGIVHRDLKPSNVLLTAAGTPKIGDFGLARRMEGESGLTWTGVAIGTPSYMAPEQAEARPFAWGPAVDVYSLGAILYELLTGRTPFRAETAAETVRQVITQDPVPPSRLNGKVPRDLETICLKCLQKEARHRYAGAEALAADLHRFLRGEAITARSEGPLARLARRVRRRPVFAAAIAVSTLSTAALLGGGLWLVADRADAARKAEADRLATERATVEDLRDMARLLKQSSWSDARVALERSKGRLGKQGSAETRRLIDRGMRDLEFVARMEAIRLESARRLRGAIAPPPYDPPYEEAFREAEIGQVGDDPGMVAARVRTSDIRDALAAALDHWSGLMKDPHRKEWALTVARKADPDSTGWRDRARDPVVRTDKTAMDDVIKQAPITDPLVPLFLSLHMDLDGSSKERRPFLKRVQQAHPGDFWVNLALAEVLSREKSDEEAIRYYQAAVSIRPELALGHESLGKVLLRVGRVEEAVVSLQRAVDLDPTSVGCLRLLVPCLLTLGRHDEVIARLETAIRINPDAPVLRSDLGRILEAEGRHTEALAQLRQAIAMQPKNLNFLRQFRDLLPPDSDERPKNLPPARRFVRK